MLIALPSIIPVMQQKRWVERNNLTNDVPEGLHPNRHIAKLLFQRGISTPEEAHKFFNPDIADLHDPFLMKDMDKAVDRLWQAINHKEKIFVYGDYDVDGTTAVAVVYSFLARCGAIVDFFIPDRYEDGYGLCRRGIDYVAQRGAKLLVVLDCGIKDLEEVEYAKEKGIDVIVGDHHRPGETIPNAFAILDPKRIDCHYPYPELSGCGVGFKLIQACVIKQFPNLHERESVMQERVYSLLGLVAISIASDIVPITGENRILSSFGLKQINTKPSAGIETLLGYSNVSHQLSGPLYFNKELTNNDLVFLVGPRINAAGRIANGKDAIKLLLCKSLEEAEKIGKTINSFNSERKSLDHQATDDALKQIEENDALKKAPATVVFNDLWSQGIIGIVASRLTETYYRPTIVFTTSKTGDTLVGSARSIKGFDIYDAIEACKRYLVHFGGHKYAAGLSILPKDFEAFKESFIRSVTERLQDIIPLPEIEIDDELTFSEITPDFFRELCRFAPFGPRNAIPTFKSSKIQDSGNGTSKIIKNSHLKVSLFQDLGDRNPVIKDGIAFQYGHLYDEVVLRKRNIEICYNIEENCWRNIAPTLQINIKDIRFND